MDTRRLRANLLDHPDAWVVADDERLAMEWAIAGDTERTLNALTYPMIRMPGGALMLRVARELRLRSRQGKLGIGQSRASPFRKAMFPVSRYDQMLHASIRQAEPQCLRQRSIVAIPE